MKRQIKSLNNIPSDLKAFALKELESCLEKYFAKPDPATLDALAQILERPMSELLSNAKEDNEDYNRDQVSRLVDKAVGIFMKAGQKGIHNGDIVRIAKDQDFLLKPFSPETLEVTRENVKESDEYSDFAYDITIWNEIRGKYLLQTEKSDNFPDMLRVLDETMPSYVGQESWEKIKQAIKKAERRIFNEDLFFPDPLEGHEEGEVKELTPEDYAKYNITKHDLFELNENNQPVKREFSEIRIDHRKDNHDLIALKELVLILKKEKPLEYFSIGPGFFNKYLPELKEVGIDGLIFKVVDEELKEIKVWQSAGHFNPKGPTTPAYSPMSAACALIQSYAATYEVTSLSDTDPTDVLWELTNFNENFLSDSTRYYVVVDGCISSPLWGSEHAPFSYEGFSLNQVQVPAGEVFLFEQRNGKAMTTRLYFTPYKPSQLHPLHQLGSVVFGSNDQTYHSTSKNPIEEAEMMDLCLLKLRFEETFAKQNDERYTASTAAFKSFFCLDKKLGATLLKCLIPENAGRVMGMFTSLYEITPFTIDHELKSLHEVSGFYTEDKIVEEMKRLLDNYAPFTKRFLYKEYLKFWRATEDVQPTFWNDLAEKIKLADTMAAIQDQVLEGKINQLSADESLSPEDYRSRLDKLLKDAKDEHRKNVRLNPRKEG